VTGRHQGSHLGNAFATNLEDVTSMVTPETAHLERLDGRFETAAYAASTSDIVALLVLEHQMRMVNLMTRVGWEARVGAAAAGRPLDRAVDELVDYLLFVDEAELPGPIAGSSTFADTFAAAAPRDRRGRSLKDFDLDEYLFKYPCSYLIYSPQFDALPANVRQQIFVRMYDVLSGRVPDPRYARLTEEAPPCGDRHSRGHETRSSCLLPRAASFRDALTSESLNVRGSLCWALGSCSVLGSE
jgi:hypothetical protein